jgi:hypothetical protein
MIPRSNCVICDNKDFCENFNLISTIDIVSSLPYEDDEVFELNFVGCKNCGCVQLKNLFEPDKIYEEPMQCFDGPILIKHHELFADFVFNRTRYYHELFEIGGSYGKIASKIINKYKENNKDINYKILEFNVDHYPPIENIEYISGNCETYNFNGVNTIIMSHVFEHLYEPKNFLKNISNHNVREVFISIPDMDNLTKIGDINNLNIYHTYYINTDIISYLFQLYKFELKDIYYYDNNSIFYYFVKKEKYLIDNLKINNTQIMMNLKNFYDTLKQKVLSISINSKFFICPSGLYGRFVYFYLNENTQKNVIGFLDSDNMKIGKRLKGTTCNTYNKQYIENAENPIVLIVSKKHQNELIDELTKYNKKIMFYCL